MGSATRQATSVSQSALSRLGSKVTLATAQQLFAAGRSLATSTHLQSTLSDPAIAPAQKAKLVKSVFTTKLGTQAAALLDSVVSQRWSSEADVLAGIENLAIRAAAVSGGAKVSIEGEIFAFARAVSSDPELELALGSALSDPATKAALVVALLGKKASAQTVTIVSELVQQPRGRRIGALLAHAAAVVADEAGSTVANVTSAQELSAQALKGLSASLTKQYGRDIYINASVDESLIGGVRVQIGADVIDGSVASRLSALKLQLAG
jgi:F-type H+-transporting ATPase subunit delta